ncbi:MAG TPA: LamG-like jellyroll fold domain-containing protein, partial [Longimicrobiaceae bacterium]
AWIRPDANPPRAWQCVWGGNGRAPRLYLNSSGAISHRFVATGTVTKMTKVDMGIAKATVPMISPDPDGVKEIVQNTDAGQVRWGVWNHLAITSDGKTWRTFLNGVEVKSGAVDGNLLAEAVEVNVGRSHDGKPDAFFAGSIDDVRVWSVARAAEQIQAAMNHPLAGNEPGLVAWYDMDHAAGAALVDRGPAHLDGVVYGAGWALAAAPAEPERAAVQVTGHTQLTVAGHRAMTGDLRIVDGDVWFRGALDLFPHDWPLRVAGDVEGTLNGSRFHLSGDAEVALCGMKLAQARSYVSNDEVRVEGRFLGAYAVLDVEWAGSDPTFRGTVGLSAHPTLDFGAIRIAGVKVADNVRLSLDLLFELKVAVDRKGFGADVTARFKINGVGFSLGFHLDVVPSDLGEIVNWVKQHIIDDPAKYLAHLFTDAATWLKNVGAGAIEFAKDAAEAVGRALKDAFKVPQEAVAGLMKAAGYAAEQVGAALSRVYRVADQLATLFLRGAGYAAEDVGRFLKNVLNHVDQMAANLLRGAGYLAYEAANALHAAYGYAADAATTVLKNAQYAVEDIGNALKTTFGKTDREAAKILKDAGYAADDVGKALSSAYNCTADAAAATLNAVGYASNEVSHTMQSVYHKSEKEAKKLVGDIGDGLSSAGNTMKKGVNSIGHAIGF